MPKEFNISPFYKGEARKVVEKAIRESNLPEGVSVVPSTEIEGAQKPFIVISAVPNAGTARQAFLKGAIDYITLVYDADEMARKLSS